MQLCALKKNPSVRPRHLTSRRFPTPHFADSYPRIGREIFEISVACVGTYVALSAGVEVPCRSLHQAMNPGQGFFNPTPIIASTFLNKNSRLLNQQSLRHFVSVLGYQFLLPSHQVGTFSILTSMNASVLDSDSRPSKRIRRNTSERTSDEKDQPKKRLFFGSLPDMRTWKRFSRWKEI